MHRPRPTKASGDFQCVLCNAKTKIHFKIPRFMQNEHLTVECSDCASRFLVKLRRLDGRHKDQYHQWISCTFKSPKAEKIEHDRAVKKINFKNPFDKMSL